MRRGDSGRENRVESPFSAHVFKNDGARWTMVDHDARARWVGKQVGLRLVNAP